MEIRERREGNVHGSGVNKLSIHFLDILSFQRATSPSLSFEKISPVNNVADDMFNKVRNRFHNDHYLKITFPVMFEQFST